MFARVLQTMRLSLIGCLVLPGAFAGQHQQLEEWPDLIARLMPSVVNISSERVGNGGEVQSLGSGVVIDPTGLIVTNYHVVDSAREIYVSLGDGTRRIAQLLGGDKKTDIALLRVEISRPVSVALLGNSDEARAGDQVLAIGNPFGFEGSVSAGIVSARNRQLDAELYDDFIQTDAAINRGNSGGPLFNRKGEVIGINSALVSPNGGSVGVSFAIPVNIVKTVVAQLKAHGRVRRGWIGAKALDLTPDLAAGFGVATTNGALIGNVASSGPAAVGGLMAGDIVIEIGGRLVGNSRDMQRLIVEAKIGRQLTLIVLRRGARQELSVRVAGRGGDEALGAGTRNETRSNDSGLLGLSLTNLDAVQMARLGLGTASSRLMVESVAARSPAAEAGVKKGDIIIEAGQSRVASAKDFRILVQALEHKGRSALLLMLNRSGEIVFKALRLPPRKLDNNLKTAAAK